MSKTNRNSYFQSWLQFQFLVSILDPFLFVVYLLVFVKGWRPISHLLWIIPIYSVTFCWNRNWKPFQCGKNIWNESKSTMFIGRKKQNFSDYFSPQMQGREIWILPWVSFKMGTTYNSIQQKVQCRNLTNSVIFLWSLRRIATKTLSTSPTSDPNLKMFIHYGTSSYTSRLLTESKDFNEESLNYSKS